MAAVALLAGALALAAGAWRGGVALPAVPLWPLAGFLALALLQLVPLPDPLHALLAPGSHAVWHPAAPEAAAVLGTAPRPVSVDPDSTLRGVALTGGLALLALLAAPAFSRPGRAVRAVAVVAAGGFALSAYAIFARARFGALLYGTIAVPTVSPFGPFVSKNHFAGWVAMAIAARRRPRPRPRGPRPRPRRRLDGRPRAGGVILVDRGRARHGAGRARLAVAGGRDRPRVRAPPASPPCASADGAPPGPSAPAPSSSPASWGSILWRSCRPRPRSGCAA